MREGTVYRLFDIYTFYISKSLRDAGRETNLGAERQWKRSGGEMEKGFLVVLVFVYGGDVFVGDLVDDVYHVDVVNEVGVACDSNACFTIGESDFVGFESVEI